VEQSLIVRSFCLAIAAIAAVGLAASASSSGSVSRAVFAVSLRGTIDQTADYKRQTLQGECPYVYTGHWNNKLELRSAKPTRLVVTLHSGRLRFSPSAISALGGTFTTRGSEVAKAPGCESVVSDCFRPAERFRGGRAPIASRRRGVFVVGRISHRQRTQPCGTAEAVGGERADLDLAPARVTASKLFGASRRRFVVSASYESDIDLGPPEVDSGSLKTRISWSLDFTWLAG
jgi:hypothetical protein